MTASDGIPIGTTLGSINQMRVPPEMTTELIYADRGACRCSPARPLNLRLAVRPNLI